MYAVEIDDTKRLLIISAVGRVTTDEVKATARKVRELLKDVAPGFRALTDLRWLSSMEPDAARDVGEIMEILQEKRVASVTRVITDSKKDIGFNILSHFHYKAEVEIHTVESMAEAIRLIEQLGNATPEN